MADAPLGAKRFGSADNPGIVFLHGFLGRADDWSPVVQKLADQFDLMTIDLPGHGVSADVPTELFDFSFACEAIKATVSQSMSGRFILCGYSMGGRIALQFALKYPALVKSLVLVSASPGIESESARLSRLASDEKLAERLSSIPLNQFIDEWYQQLLFASLRNSPMYTSVAAARASGDRAAIARALVGFSTGRQHPLWDRLKELQMPVCYVAGESDTKYTAIGRRVADLCPLGKLHIIPGAGHAVHIEQPEELSRVIASFVQPHA